MRVKATKKGFDGMQLREPGVIFDVSEKQFSGKWMERIDGKPANEPKKASRALKKGEAKVIPQAPLKPKTASDSEVI